MNRLTSAQKERIRRSLLRQLAPPRSRSEPPGTPSFVSEEVKRIENTMEQI